MGLWDSNMKDQINSIWAHICKEIFLIIKSKLIKIWLNV